MHINIKFPDGLLSISFQEFESLSSDIGKLVSVEPMEPTDSIRGIVKDATVKERDITVHGCIYPPKHYRIDDFAYEEDKRIQVGTKTYEPEEVKQL